MLWPQSYSLTVSGAGLAQRADTCGLSLDSTAAQVLSSGVFVTTNLNCSSKHRNHLTNVRKNAVFPLNFDIFVLKSDEKTDFAVDVSPFISLALSVNCTF
jgi:hypothetical protein